MTSLQINLIIATNLLGSQATQMGSHGTEAIQLYQYITVYSSNDNYVRYHTCTVI